MTDRSKYGPYCRNCGHSKNDHIEVEEHKIECAFYFGNEDNTHIDNSLFCECKGYE